MGLLSDDQQRVGSGRRAVITGIAGQDGSFLAELLLGRGYEVHGVVRRASLRWVAGIEHLGARAAASLAAVPLHVAPAGSQAVQRVLEDVDPDEVYHLEPVSAGGGSSGSLDASDGGDGSGSDLWLDAIKAHRDRTGRDIRIVQAVSAAVYGSSPAPQSEETPLRPATSRARAEAAAHRRLVAARQRQGLHASTAVLFDHESERQERTAFSRSVTRGAARIRLGLQARLSLGGLDVKRDWGDARDHARAMWLMLQQDEPGDYVIATGLSRTARGFVNQVFGRLGLDWRDHVEVEARPDRSSQVDERRGDPSRARRQLGWSARVAFDVLVDRMVNYDIQTARREKQVGRPPR
ncbi:MAG: GDP-mannose 4,6-dehydratase [Deinococcales bacterium]